MIRLRFPLLLCCLLASCQGRDDPEPPKASDPKLLPTTPDDVKYIRQLRRESADLGCATCSAGVWMRVYELGNQRLIAACQALLAKPEDAADIEDAFAILGGVKGDRSRFVADAVKALRHADSSVRERAAMLLSDIGTVNEAPALIPLLYDPESDVGYRAVHALAKIGGHNELRALDDWLSKVDRERVVHDYKYLEEVRDEFANRLAREAKASAKVKR